jgi:hypothetical protein
MRRSGYSCRGRDHFERLGTLCLLSVPSPLTGLDRKLPFSAPSIVTKSFQVDWRIERYSTPSPLDLFLQSFLQLSFLARSLFDFSTYLTDVLRCLLFTYSYVLSHPTLRPLLCNLHFPAEQRSLKGGNSYRTHSIVF